MGCWCNHWLFHSYLIGLIISGVMSRLWTRRMVVKRLLSSLLEAWPNDPNRTKPSFLIEGLTETPALETGMAHSEL